MITGDLKSKIDRIWDSFWSGGIANPLEVIEQITYLLFLRRLDDLHTLAEHKATRTRRSMERCRGLTRHSSRVTRRSHYDRATASVINTLR